jgi:LPXTG-motif cell wall-anchored protein
MDIMKVGTRILAFLTVFVMVFSGYAMTPAQASSFSATVTVTKVAEGTTTGLAGAKFKLQIEKTFIVKWWEDAGYPEATTNGSGVATWTVTGSGKYRAVETQAAPGYVTEDKTTSGTNVNTNGSTVSLGTVTNKPQGTITIVKRDAADNTKLLDGAKFSIYKGWVSSSRRVASNLVTGSNGTGTVVSAPLDPDDDYIVVEETAPEWYRIDDESKDDIEVTSGNTTTVYFNDTKMGKIKIVKHDAEFPDILVKGAEFDIYKTNTNYSNRVAHGLTTGSDGSVTSGLLEPRSDYIVVETDAPDGYRDNDTPIRGVTVTGGAVTAVDFNDTRKRYDLYIYKDIEGECPFDDDYDEYTFTFRLTNNATGEVFTKTLKGQEFCKITVPYGTYTLEEIDIPAGFKFAGFTDTLLLGDKITTKKVDHDLSTVYCHNDRVGTVKITKQDQFGKGLVGAKYDVFYKKYEGDSWPSTPLYNDILTNASGEIVLPEQKFGWYKVVEVAAPEKGYAFTPDTAVIKKINVVNETETFAFVNAQLFGSVNIVKEVGKHVDDPASFPDFTVRITGPSDNPNVASASHDYTIAPNDTTTIDGLAYGTYSIIELDKFGYENTSLSPDTFEVSGSATPTITIGNTKLYGGITVTKTISNGLPKPGDVFMFELWKAPIIPGDTYIGTPLTITPPATTCTFTGLPYGDYIVRERTLEGYAAVADIPVTVNEPAEGVTCENTKRYGSIQVNKAFAGTVPADDTEFTFRLYLNGVQVGDDKVLTWAAGGASVKFTGLEYGYTYDVVEVSKDGYAVDPDFAGPDGLPVTITGDDIDYEYTCTNTMQGKIQITKTDKDTGALLDGAVFTVTPPTGSAFTLTSGADGAGVATSGWLMPGDYTVQETTPPDTYGISDPAARTVTVTGGATAPVAFTDEKGSALIIKRSTFGGKLPIAGVLFQLMTKNTSDPAPGDIVGEALTNASGIARFDRLDIGRTYYVREKQEAPGYDRETKVEPVTPKLDPALDDAIGFADNPLGTVQVTKTDAADATKKLAGAVLGIYSDSECKTLVQTMPATGADGVAAGEPLPFGGSNPAAYYVKEITPPAGYSLNAAAQSVTFTEPGQTVPLAFTDARSLGSLVIKKVDALDHTKVLAGAQFKLYTDKAMTTQVGAAVTTDARGIARFDGLTPGDYWLMETVAPTNYDLPTEPLPVEVTAGVTNPEPFEIQNQYNPPEDIATGMMDWNILLIGGLALLAGGLIVFLTRRRSRSAAK